jgi:hypothetical protein
MALMSSREVPSEVLCGCSSEPMLGAEDEHRNRAAPSRPEGGGDGSAHA